MHKSGDLIQLTATDLAGHLYCGCLTQLNVKLVNGLIPKPRIHDPSVEILAERGRRHETAYVEHMRGQGLTILEISGEGTNDALAGQTAAAMRDGVDVIVQGVLRGDGWVGKADILRRITEPSDLGDWSYQVLDTKLARTTKGGSVLQLCLYTDLAGEIQGRLPEFMHIVKPVPDFAPEFFRFDDYAAYYRRIKSSLLSSISSSARADLYPDPKEHCQVCRWRLVCDAKRRQDDHLSLVARISKMQITELNERGIATLADLAVMPLPLPFKPGRGAKASYERIREQARIQAEGRGAGRVLHEMLPIEPGLGLCLLPSPSAGDVFFDLEGDPFVDGGGLEYLFGYAYAAENGSPAYTARWVMTRQEEKAAFEEFVDFIFQRLAVYSDLHIYHYAPYEPGAMKRLMGRYATREDEIDSLLRSKRFIDLYSVVRNALRASVESYSIKQLEPLYGFEREAALDDAGTARFRVESALELDCAADVAGADRDTVEAYNRDDCVSNWRLRDWLESCRAQLIADGNKIDRPTQPTAEPPENVAARQVKVGELAKALTADVPDDITLRTPEQHGRWLLANLLDWHRREKKSFWWEHFRICDLSDEDLLDETKAISGLEFEGAFDASGKGRQPIHRYAFPEQDMELRVDDFLCTTGDVRIGTLVAIDYERRLIDIKKRQDSVDLHPRSVFAHNYIDDKEVSNSLIRLAEYVVEHGMMGPGPYPAARGLLMRQRPQTDGVPLILPGELSADAARRIATHLGSGVLPIQGPPGSGKTHTAANMICELVKAGKKVGITANSHKVIRNLLDKVIELAHSSGRSAIQCVQKPDGNEMRKNLPGSRFVHSNSDLQAAIQNDCQVAGATAWFWARQDSGDTVDVLFVALWDIMWVAGLFCPSSVCCRRLRPTIRDWNSPGGDPLAGRKP